MVIVKVLVILVLLTPVPVMMDMDVTESDTRNLELDRRLKEELLKDPKNLDMITNGFGRTPKDEVKVCGRLTYSMKFRSCSDNTTQTATYTLPWTSADLSTIAGEVLYRFADLSLEILGFEWGPICDLRTESAPVLKINAESVPMACLENRGLVLESLVRLTDQMPSIVNNSDLTSVHSSAEDEKVRPWLMIDILIAGFLTSTAVVSFYHEAQFFTRSTAGKKPKAYFLFWGFHLFALGLLIHTFHGNVNIRSYYMILGGTLVAAVVNSTCLLSCWSIDIETPTHCCRCLQWISHRVVLFLSTIVLHAFLLFTIAYAIPTIVLILYLNTIGTLLRLTIIANIILIVTTLLAFLIYQYERFCHLFAERKPKRYKPIFEERATNHDQYYSSQFPAKGKGFIGCYTYIYQPVGTILALVVFIFLIQIIFELVKQTDYTKEYETQLLVAIIPSVMFLFGYCYKLRKLLHAEKKLLPDTLDTLEVPAAIRRSLEAPEPTQQRGGSPERLPPGSPERLPPGSPERLPPGSPERLPPGSPERLPPGSPERLPPGSPERLPPGSPERLPPGSPERLPPGSPERLPPGRPERLPPGRPERLPPGRPERLPPGRPERLPPGRPERLPPGRPERLPPGRPERLPPGRPEPPPRESANAREHRRPDPLTRHGEGSKEPETSV